MAVALILIVAFLVIPAFGNQFFLNTMMIPFSHPLAGRDRAQLR